MPPTLHPVINTDFPVPFLDIFQKIEEEAVETESGDSLDVRTNVFWLMKKDQQGRGHSFMELQEVMSSRSAQLKSDHRDSPGLRDIVALSICI